jgi:TolB protein
LASDRNKTISRRALMAASGPLAALAALAPASSMSAWASGAGPQQGEIYLELRDRIRKPITVAVPPLSLVPGAEGEATILLEVLRNDLHHSMVFEVVDPELYPPLPPGDQAPDFPAWRRTGAEALVRGFVRREGDAVLVDFRIYDVQSGQQVIGERVTGEVPPAQAIVSNSALRGIAHAFSDVAVLYYTGIPGVASTRIAYVSNRRGPKEIYLMDYDGYGDTRITNDGGLALSPALSPGGEQIAYVTYRFHEGVPNVDIAMLNKLGGVPPVIARSAGQDTSPEWSRDGSRIVFSSTMDGLRDGNAEIYTMRPDGSDVQRITNSSAVDTSPTFSPNGREIAFISDRAGGQHLYKMAIDGTNLERHRVEGSQVDSPAWNPNPQISDLIAYTASEGGNSFQIFVYSLTTRQSVKLTQGYGRADSPSWSPDGRQIVFEASQGDQNHIYAIGFDGSRLRRLTREGNNQTPSWGGR